MRKVQVRTKTPSTDKPEGTAKKNRVAIYARVSTNKEEQESSMEFQRQQVTKIENEGGIVTRIYADEGVSGRSLKKRKEFQRMLEDAYKGEFDWVYTKNISRFARNLADMSNATRELENLGIYVYFSEEDYRTDNTANKIVLDLLSSIAEQESRNTSSHVRSVVKEKYKKGQIAILSRSPLGYDFSIKKDPETGERVWSYEPNKDSQLVKEIFRICIEGHGSSYIASEIYKLYGKKLPKQSIDYVLSNPVYKGTLELNRNGQDEELYVVENNHKAIISSDLWELAQLSRKERQEANSKCAPKGIHANWRNKIVCRHCGGYYWGRKPTYLACGNSENKNAWDKTCTNNHLIRTDGVLNELNSRVLKILHLDAQTYKEHYTDEEWNALKKVTEITAQDITKGWFEANEDYQILSLTLSMGVEVELKTTVGNAQFTNSEIAIRTEKRGEGE